MSLRPREQVLRTGPAKSMSVRLPISILFLKGLDLRLQVGRDGTASGWLTDNGERLSSFLPASTAPGSIDWRAGDFKEGDLVVLHQNVLHMTACNASDCFRISCDTRWQPSADPSNPKLGSWRAVGGQFAD